MAGGQALDLLPQIEALVSDKLQVVSYKWLSRNFSLTSNYAKRLLQEFVDTHGSELEVIYALSGWLKDNPQTYHIKLASGLKLAEVKHEFVDNCSVQVYSVQACIPQDSALLWNAEFVQAEEFFNQPLTAENCLRDNRYCGVSNSFVKRTIDGKSVGAIPHPMNLMGAAMQSKPNTVSKTSLVQPLKQEHAGKSAKIDVKPSTLETSNDKSNNPAPENFDRTSKPDLGKEATCAVQATRKKGQCEKTSSASSGSLANLWGRASTKLKPSAPSIETDKVVSKVAPTAEAQICAQEAADASSSDDDDHQVNCKRESKGGSNRKRKVIMDFSDDEEEENVVNLASPDPPSRLFVDSKHHTEHLISENKNLNFEEIKKDTSVACQDNGSERNSSSTREVSGNKGSNIFLQPKTENHVSEELDKIQKDMVSPAATSPQRRKVLKTRVDERGREVTEVVWEGSGADNKNSEKNNTAGNHGNRPPTANKAPAASSNSLSNAATNKAGNKKTAKGGGKDTKQGNILSFFKKV
ncbi:uncharacterized protein LOC120262515 [Dioscorea cayenensis subsp. rotundata]|uniref:DNA polymerase delta subunit 3 n=1 Tax=Dioscorea cayennensis subsp. rotundata TaxID=55577 RepID=A0AB40BGQ6_DIOCR|nr:uncharacterized protein LOC120262515 [Dioscorea cayenensis subsp. rotundata]XP_039126585.1 uncharacterized protein LOC120262515 [Dioscorea cayenensis subsp. rotundata]